MAFSPAMALLAFRAREDLVWIVIFGVPALLGVLVAVVAARMVRRGNPEPFGLASIEDASDEVIGHVGSFREIGLIDKHVRGWVTGITDRLPMTPASEAELLRVAREDSQTWRRLREIRRRGHLARVELADVLKYANKVGLDPKSIVRQGKLVFDPGIRFGFLHLLNEDLYRGDLANVTFEAQRKAATGP